jgi:adenylosuccinate synthase
VNAQRATIVVDLAFGDCGKGSIVDFLTREHADAGETPLIVRFNGGPQAGHNVVTPAPDGRHHTFAQFGSGTFVPRVRTLLSRFMVIEPYALINEAEHLRALGVGDALARLVVDDNCLVITPPQQAANRLRELARSADAHGTCGMGVGEAMADAIEHPELILRARELADRAAVGKKLRAVREMKVEHLRDAIASLGDVPRARQAIETLVNDDWIDVAIDNYAWLAGHISIVDERAAMQIVRDSRALVLEGAQGVLLDETRGFHPHTTWSTTTFFNADVLLDVAGFAGARTRLGVLRSYFTRHGPGPFVTEDAALLEKLPEPHNDAGGWQGGFRVGAFDAVAARYSTEVAGRVDGIALTHLDRLPALPRHICTEYHDGDGVIRALPARRLTDLAFQAKLTRRLNCCRPVYTPTDTADADRVVAAIEHELDVRVAITSHGPTASDKRRRIVSP